MEIRGKQKPREANQPTSFLNRHALGQKCNNLKLITYSLMADWPGIINPPFKNPGSAPGTLSLLQKRLQQLLLDHVLEILKR